ncbi:MAG: Asp-tRNA(Asn)/Glu-tRNA(Gln) amidotransferase subunit GatB [Eubacteriales bacterium]|nr:Asp-tRNA(Asn)/Glu-tRNA(Gln) amidotransferase subunit GatB [Eubacteriales bacterium]
MKYETVIGLETHVELNTKSKIFCACGGHGASEEPNDCVCPACCGMPGMLPVTNKRVIELAVTAGLMLNCDISRYTTFDKKNYYYPDLPCAYQITQLNHPICTNGLVSIKSEEGNRDIRIKQIHMEEDAGKLIHEGKYSLVDFNRTSVPLIEVVTQPDFRSPQEVMNYLNKLKSMFRSGGISECENGAMRCDVNISVRPEGTEELGVRSEIKNMSSFESIEKAIYYEIQRHIDALEYDLEELVQETRRFDEKTGKTFAMRDKETAADYRYFPDPNLMPILIDDEWLEQIMANKPVAVDERIDYYRESGISEEEITVLISSQTATKLLEEVVAAGCDARETVKWILIEAVGVLRKGGKGLDDLQISAEDLSAIIKMVTESKINRNSGKAALAALIEEGISPEEYIKSAGIDRKLDSSDILAVVQKVISDNQDIVEAYKSGKTKAFQALLGACMRELKGAGNPGVIKEMLEKNL